LQRPSQPRFAVLGGTFSPVHLGHVALAKALVELPGVDQVLVLPAAQNPLKAAPAVLPPPVRWEMLRAALAGVSRVAVLDLELVRGAPSYSVDSLAELALLYPLAAFDWVLGWDAFRDFPRWRAAEQVLALAGLLVVPRAGISPIRSTEEVQACLPVTWRDRLQPGAEGVWRDAAGRRVVTLANLEVPEISATDLLRERAWHLVPESARPILLRHLGAPPA
jgi:nicotinate-nucleotide adenylyltransferase